MKESYGKGIANHPGPESCGQRRKVLVEALTGVHVGWVLSSEINRYRTPTQSGYAAGNMAGIDNARFQLVLRSRRPQANMETQWAGTERSRWRRRCEKPQAEEGTP